MEKQQIDKHIKETITRVFFKELKRDFWDNIEGFFSLAEVWTGYLRGELTKFLEIYLEKIFKQENVVYITNLDYVRLNNLDIEVEKLILDLHLNDILCFTTANKVSIIYNYRIDEINCLVDNLTKNVKEKVQ